ncbi:MAG: hypothetical protein R2751_04475 [Bacteroidales bacterium]
MKKSWILLALLTGCLGLSAQENKSLSFSADWVHSSRHGMMGPGYTLSFQRHLRGPLWMEAGASYGIASRSVERDREVNQVRMLDLNYHHAGYAFFAGPLVHLGKPSGLSVEVSTGFALGYQSNVFDRNHYEILTDSEYVYGTTDVVYDTEVVEGLFPGARAALRIQVPLGPAWALLAGGEASVYHVGIPLFKASLGVRCHF